MKKQLITFIAFVTFPAFAFAQTAAEIIDKNIAAVGGADKIAAIKTVTFDQNMNIMGMDLAAKTSIVVGKSSRSDISAMGQQITTVIDGDKGWMVNPAMGAPTPTAIPDEQIKTQKGNVYVLGTELATTKEKKYPVELIGKEKVGDKDVYNLKVTGPDGIMNYYVDAATYLLNSAKTTVNVQGQSGEVKMQYGNYKTIEGFNLPSTIEINSPGMPGAITMTVSNVVFNPTIDPTIFAMPK